MVQEIYGGQGETAKRPKLSERESPVGKGSLVLRETGGHFRAEEKHSGSGVSRRLTWWQGAGATNQPAAKKQSRSEVIGSKLGWKQGSGKQG